MKVIKALFNIPLSFLLGLFVGFPYILYSWATKVVTRKEALSYLLAVFSPWQYNKELRTGEIWFWEL
jgi:hypothetical protein